MSSEGPGNWAYASMLAGGVLIVVGGLAGALMMATWGAMMPFGMMGGYGLSTAMAGTWIAGMAWWMGVVGVLAGGMVLYGAYRLRRHPADTVTAGMLAIVGGAASTLAMGGWLVGAILAIVGGALAIAESGKQVRPSPPAH